MGAVTMQYPDERSVAANSLSLPRSPNGLVHPLPSLSWLYCLL